MVKRPAAKANRGRVQAQGQNVEKSVDWGEDVVPRASQGHALLEQLLAKLTASEQAHREEAFSQAHVGVDQTARIGGIPQDGRYPASKSYPQPPRRDGRRVDLEVWAGRAFQQDVGGTNRGGGPR